MTLFSDAEIIALGIFIVLYTIVGIIVGIGISSSLEDSEHLMKNDKVSLLSNLSYMERNRDILSLICGVLWIFAVAYLIGHQTGEDLYEKAVIGKDEESRIAAWLF